MSFRLPRRPRRLRRVGACALVSALAPELVATSIVASDATTLAFFLLGGMLLAIGENVCARFKTQTMSMGNKL